jgi:lipopolysaccharide export system permease protein
MLVNGFAMAVLLAALLGFGRLSSDSEIVALKAGGAGILRVVWPAMVFSTVIAIATFIFNDQIVPPAASESQALVEEIANRKQGVAGQPVSFPIVKDGKMSAQLMAQAFSIFEKTLSGVTIVAYDKEKRPSFFMFCNRLEYKGTDDWHIRGGGYFVPADGHMRNNFDEAWPDAIPKPTLNPQDIATINNGDNNVYSMKEIQRQISRGRRDGSLTPERIHNLEYGYWNKISVALAAIVFGTLGAVLGIRNQRTSTASGFAMAIAIIFGYFTLANFMNVWALDGALPAWMASFSPILIGAVSACVIMWRRNA